MAVNQDIVTLRERTGAAIMDAKKALEQAGGDLEQAIGILKKKGMKIAQEKSGRLAKEGTIGSYVHANGKVAALVLVSCETDFVARTPEFQELAHDIAIQVAATNPQYVAPNDVPSVIVEKERQLIMEEFKGQKKPVAVLEKIVQGRLEKFFTEVCLVKQPFVKDDTKTIEALLHEKTARLKEHIEIKDFKRLAL